MNMRARLEAAQAAGLMATIGEPSEAIDMAPNNRSTDALQTADELERRYKENSKIADDGKMTNAMALLLTEKVEEIVAALRAAPPTTKPSGASDETGAVALPDAVGFMLRGEVYWEPRLKPEDGALVYAYRREQK